MRIYAIVDIKSKDYASINGCLEGLRGQFKDVVPVTWTIEYRNFDNLAWETYGYKELNDKGVAFSQVNTDTKQIFTRDKYLYDTVMYFIDVSNWKAGTAKGWNLGQFFNNYQVQLLETSENLRLMNLIIREELAHSIDDFAIRELGRNINVELGLDYDEDIVHDRNNSDGVRGDYRTFYLGHKTLIQDIIKARQNKAIASLIAKIGVLLRDLLMKMLSKPKATTDYH